MRRSFFDVLRSAALFGLVALPLEADAQVEAEGGHAEGTAQEQIDRAAAVAGEHADEQHAPGVDHPTAASAEHGAHQAHGGHDAAAAEHEAAGGAHHAAPPINWLDFGYRKKDTHGGSLESGEEPMAPPFAMAILNFVIFAGLIVKFGGPKVRSALRERHDTIKRDLAEAARLRKEAGDKLAEYTSRMAKVNSEVDALIAEIRADADAEKARILEDARLQAAALKKDADDRIASEFARARLELEREVVAAAIGAAEKILRERTTPTDQQALFDGFVSTLNRPTSGGGKPPTGGGPSGSPPATDDISKGWS